MQNRNSNIELLRIFSILMIIAHHYCIHGGFETLSLANTVFIKLLGGGGAKIGVACFVLITGFFGDRIRPGRVVKIVKDRWMYSFLMTIVILLFGIHHIDAKLLIYTIAPILTCRHNYITVFCMLYLFIPFLNRIVDTFPRKLLERVIVMSMVLFSLFPTVYPHFASNTYSYIFWMMFLFVIGRCLSKYDYNLPWGNILVLSIIVILFCLFVVEPLTPYPEGRIVNAQYSLPVLIVPICLIKIFEKMDIGYNKVINWLASSTFAVYVIHDDPYIRNYIWSQIFHNSEFAMSIWLPLHFLCVVIIIYLFCVLIDKFLRSMLFKFVDKLSIFTKAENRLNSLLQI